MTEDQWMSELTAEGFHKQSMGSNRELYKLADEFWQLRVRAVSKTLYFVNAYIYREKRYDNGNVMSFGVMFEVSFYLPYQDMSFSVTAHYPESVHKALTFFDSIYNRMECVPDLHNND